MKYKLFVEIFSKSHSLHDKAAESETAAAGGRGAPCEISALEEAGRPSTSTMSEGPINMLSSLPYR